MRRKIGFVAQLIYKDVFAGRVYCLLQENRKRGKTRICRYALFSF